MKAFPCEWSEYDPNQEWISINPYDLKSEVFKGKYVPKFSTGMDLRDYFAAKAMPIILKDWYEDGLFCGDDGNAEHIANISYLVADAMMKARDGNNSQD